MSTMKKQRGLSLVELMIGIVVGLLVVGATITTYMVALRGSAESLNSSRLNQELRSSVTQIANELRRSGYRLRTLNNTAEDPTQTAQFTALTISADRRCIIYAYDQPAAPGTEGQFDQTDRAGFRFVENRIETGNNVTCASDVNWRAITDPARVNITNVVFTTAQANANASRCRNLSLTTNDTWRLTTTNGVLQACDITATNQAQEAGIAVPAANHLLYETRIVGIRITGSLVGDAANIATVEESVKLMNDRMFRKP